MYKASLVIRTSTLLTSLWYSYFPHYPHRDPHSSQIDSSESYLYLGYYSWGSTCQEVSKGRLHHVSTDYSSQERTREEVNPSHSSHPSNSSDRSWECCRTLIYESCSSLCWSLIKTYLSHLLSTQCHPQDNQVLIQIQVNPLHSHSLHYHHPLDLPHQSLSSSSLV